jgi:hypothetical protein
MRYNTISYDDAIKLQNQGDIILIDISGGQLAKVDNEYGQLWKDNFHQLLIKTPHVPTNKILEYYSAKYVCEILQTKPHGECFQYTWRYLYGIENKQILNKSSDNTEYVYILVNEGYKHLVKIGMTTSTVEQRMVGLNTSGILDEWQPKFAIAVTKGSALKVEQQVHKAFANVRVSSNKGGRREFFQVDCLTAFDKLREIGSLHMIGNPIVY